MIKYNRRRERRLFRDVCVAVAGVAIAWCMGRRAYARKRDTNNEYLDCCKAIPVHRDQWWDAGEGVFGFRKHRALICPMAQRACSAIKASGS
jgi:hypothetical protein